MDTKNVFYGTKSDGSREDEPLYRDMISQSGAGAVQDAATGAYLIKVTNTKGGRTS